MILFAHLLLVFVFYSLAMCVFVHRNRPNISFPHVVVVGASTVGMANAIAAFAEGVCNPYLCVLGISPSDAST